MILWTPSSIDLRAASIDLPLVSTSVVSLPSSSEIGKASGISETNGMALGKPLARPAKNARSLEYSVSSETRAGWPLLSTQALPMAGSVLLPEQHHLTHSNAASLFFDQVGMNIPSPPMSGLWAPLAVSPRGVMSA